MEGAGGGCAGSVAVWVWCRSAQTCSGRVRVDGPLGGQAIAALEVSFFLAHRREVDGLRLRERGL